jgi:hypothetical protein
MAKLLERIAYVRETVRMTLDGQLADRTAWASRRPRCTGNCSTTR